MRTGARLVVVTVAGGLLAGCSVTMNLEPTTAATSPEVVALEAEGDDGARPQDDGPADDPPAADAPADDAGAADEIAPGTPLPVADVVARIDVEPWPEVQAATGTPVTSGAVSLVIPSDHEPAGAYGGVQLFEGPAIRGARAAAAGVQVYPPVADATWAQRLGAPLAPGQEGLTSTVYALDVPGADAAVVHVVTDTEGRTGEDRAGRRVWQAPLTTAHVLVGVGEQVTRVVLQAAPTPDGLASVLSVARTVTVAP